DAGVAAKGMQLVAHANKPAEFHPDDPGGLTYANSDLAFGGKYLYQGNFSGIQIWTSRIPPSRYSLTTWSVSPNRATCRSTATCSSCRPRTPAAGSTAVRKESRTV